MPTTDQGVTGTYRRKEPGSWSWHLFPPNPSTFWRSSKLSLLEFSASHVEHLDCQTKKQSKAKRRCLVSQKSPWTSVCSPLSCTSLKSDLVWVSVFSEHSRRWIPHGNHLVLVHLPCFCFLSRLKRRLSKQKLSCFLLICHSKSVWRRAPCLKRSLVPSPFGCRSRHQTKSVVCYCMSSAVYAKLLVVMEVARLCNDTPLQNHAHSSYQADSILHFHSCIFVWSSLFW